MSVTTATTDQERVIDLRERRPDDSIRYDAFISYSTAADAQLAEQIEIALQRLAKPWRKRRALEIFRDAADLPATSDLSSELRETLEKTRTLVFLASEESAASKWCGQELDYWLDERPPEEFIIVLTGGELIFGEHEGSSQVLFDRSSAAPPSFSRLTTEPLYIDMRDLKAADIEAPFYETNSDFRARVTQISAALHTNKRGTTVSPSQIDSEDKRAHDRLKRAGRIAGLTLLLLTIAAIVAAFIANANRIEAEANARESQSRALASAAEAAVIEEPDLAALLALESVRTDETGDAQGALVAALSTPSRFIGRTAEHQHQITAIAFSPDGELVTTADSSGGLVIWEIDNEALFDPPSERWSLPAVLDAPIVAIAYGNDASEVGVVADDGSVAWLDTRSGEIVESFAVPFESVKVGLSPNFEFLIGIYGSGEILVWDNDKQIRAETTMLTDSSLMELGERDRGLVFSPEADFVVWGEGATLRVWEWETGAEPFDVAMPDFVNDVDVSTDNDTIVVGLEEGNLITFSKAELFSGAEQFSYGQSYNSPTSPVLGVAFTASIGVGSELLDTGFVASTHFNGDVNLWVLDGDRDLLLIETLQGHNEATFVTDFGPAGTLATGDLDGEVLWWSEQPLRYLGVPLTGQGEDPVTPEGNVLGIAFDSETVWALDDQQGLMATDGEASSDLGEGEWTAIDATDQTLVLGDAYGDVFVYNFAADSFLDLPFVHDAAIAAVDLTDDDRFLATMDEAGRVAVWDVAQGVAIQEIDITSEFSALPDALLVASESTLWLGGADENGAMIAAFDIASGAKVRTMRHGVGVDKWVISLAVSADGTRVASGGADRDLYLWDTETFEQVGDAFVGHREYVRDIVFFEDGSTLIASDDDGGVHLWDIDSRTIIASLEGPTDAVRDLALSPDGLTLVAGSDDDQLYAWSMDPMVWRERACLLAGRNMTEFEWNLYGSGDYVAHCPDRPAAIAPG